MRFQTTKTPMAVAVAALILAAGGCSGAGSLAPPDDTPYVTGVVVAVEPRRDGATLRVEAGPGSQEPCGILATVDGGTRLLRRARNGRFARAALSDVQVGQAAEVYVTGPVMESCPPQARADAVVLSRPEDARG